MSTHQNGEGAETPGTVRTVGADDESPPGTGPEEQSEKARAATEIAELEDRWRRAVADLENLRKRHARELQAARTAERARVASAWLPVIDTLELALAHAGSGSDAIVEGVRAIRDQAIEILARLGYPRHDQAGVPFDPQLHEVVGVVDAPDTEPGTVVEVTRPGYGNGENQLRPAAVIVSRARE